VTDTHASTTTPAPVFPPGRYGRRRAPSRRRPWLMAVLVVAALAVTGAVAVRLYQNYGDPAYDAQVVTYTGVTDNGLNVVFRVTIPEGRQADCLVRARSRDGAEVGHETVRVHDTPGDGPTQITHHLPTTAKPMLGEVLRCVPAD